MSNRSRQLEQVLNECHHLLQAGESFSDDEIVGKHPSLMPELAGELTALREDFAKQQLSGDSTLSLHDVSKSPGEPDRHRTVSTSDSLLSSTPVRYFGDYELLDLLGRGGMGVVYRARQVSLNRVVAVKMILSGDFASEQGIQRFQAEAEAAAKLDHPGIVSIYEIGRHEGHHYFSMQCIVGASLAEITRENPLPSRTAAEYVQKTSVAMAYAHDCGVLHRDLKPANVLIDSDGHPHVTDFGLAKRVDADSEMTATGQILGTPSYMPPEQALGERDKIGPKSDVYSLGATLYAIVTGRPPFQAESPASTLIQVVYQEAVEPRSLNPAIDRDLETICLKCLEKDPEQRYASASELADELNRYLLGEPILARPISGPQRAWRWCKRKPLVASLSSAIVLLMIVGTTVSTYFAIESSKNAEFFRTERDRADTKATEAEQALARESKALAEQLAALTETEQTIDAYIETVENAELLKEPRFKPLLQELLKDAKTHYQRYINRHGDGRDLEHRKKLGKSLSNIGQLNWLSGSLTEALDSHQRALAIWQKVVDQQPDIIEHQHELAYCYYRLSWINRELSKYPAARSAHQTYVAMVSALVEQHPEDQDTRAMLASAHEKSAGFHDDFELAVKDYDRAIELYEAIIEDFPDHHSHEGLLRTLLSKANRYFYKALQDRNNVDMETADALCQRGLAIAERLAEEDPANYTENWAYFLNLDASIYLQSNHPTAAIERLEHTLDLIRQRAQEFPNQTRLQYRVAFLQTELGTAYHHAGELAKAKNVFEASIPVLDRVIYEDPSRQNYQGGFDANVHLGQIYYSTRNFEQAIASFRKALDLLTSERAGGELWERQLKALALSELAKSLRAAGENEQSLQTSHEAISILHAVSEQTDLAPREQFVLLICLIRVGELLKENEAQEALQFLDEAHELSVRMPAESATIATGYKAEELLRVKGQMAVARSAIMRPAIATLLENKDFSEAVDQIDSLISGDTPVAVVFAAFENYASGVAALANDETLPEAERTELRKRFTEGAIHSLRRIAGVNYLDEAKRFGSLHAAPQYSALRSQPEFRDFLTKLTAELDERKGSWIPWLLATRSAIAIDAENWTQIGDTYCAHMKDTDINTLSTKSCAVYVYALAAAEHKEGYALLQPRLWEILVQPAGHVYLRSVGRLASLFPIEDETYRKQAREVSLRKQYRQVTSRAQLHFRCGDYERAKAIFDHLDDSLDCRFVAAAIAAKLGDDERARTYYDEAVKKLDDAIQMATQSSALHADWQHIASILVWRREAERAMEITVSDLQLSEDIFLLPAVVPSTEDP